jgi:hypothetical protein
MAFDSSLLRLALLPGFIQTGNGESRKAHWLGNRQAAERGQDQRQSGQEERPPRRPDPRGYRDLTSITLGEVEDSIQRFQAQLVPSPVEGWIAKNYFCQLPLKRRTADRPPLVFGRVKTVYPSDGQVQNMEEMELYFPGNAKRAAPDVLHLRDHDISLQKPAQSFCVGVKFYLSPEEVGDFAPSENIFIEKGFAPLYENGYLSLLDVNEQDHHRLPWLHVIGSGWFATIPDSLQPEIREQLRNFVRRGTIIFNYHPRRHALRYLSLNEELDFQYGFGEHYLVAPQNSDQTLRKVEESFGQIFMRGLG